MPRGFYCLKSTLIDRPKPCPTVGMTATKDTPVDDICQALGPLMKARVNDYCKKHSISQKNLAEQLRIHRTSFGNMHGNMGYGTVMKILDATQNLDLVEIIKRASDPETQSPGLREFLQRLLAQRITSAERVLLYALDLLGAFQTKTADEIEEFWDKVARGVLV